MTDLRDALHRVADSTDPLPVADDLWQRAQTSRRRGQALVVAAVLAIIASVTWSAVVLGQEDREARTASSDVVEGGAVPRSIEDVPDDLAVTTDLAVGRGSAAFVSSGRPVAITATDGLPHRLDLPGWERTPTALALSPDGRTLAYQDGSGESGTYLTLVDLETGRSSRAFADDSQRLQLSELSWSPDGRWLAWIATTQDGLVALLGRVDTSDPRPRQVRAPSDATSLAVSDDGAALVGRAAGELLLAEPDRSPVSVHSGPGIGAGAFSPDGRLVALRTSVDTSSHTWDVDAGEMVSHPFPEDTLGAVELRPLGWLDDRLQVLLAQDTRGTSGELVVTTATVDGTSTWRRSVGRVDPDVVGTLSIAVDLLPDLDGTSSQQLTHDFGGERDISWIIGLGVAAAIAVLMALRWLWRRLLG